MYFSIHICILYNVRVYILFTIYTYIYCKLQYKTQYIFHEIELTEQ
jgi:hypothetical protein